jgi:hypothetical protein
MLDVQAHKSRVTTESAAWEASVLSMRRKLPPSPCAAVCHGCAIFEQQLLHARAPQRVALATYITRYKKGKGATEGVRFGRPVLIGKVDVVDACTLEPWQRCQG